VLDWRFNLTKKSNIFGGLIRFNTIYW